MNLLAQLEKKFGRVHHRALNDLKTLETLSASAQKESGYTEMAEGDLCWHVENGKVIAYLWHPNLLKPLSKSEIERKSALGQLLLLEDILKQDFGHIPFIIELKSGSADTNAALEHILGILEDARPKNYWIDTFSPGLLKQVKKISPGTLTSLHTKMVVKNWALKTAVERMPVGVLSIPHLGHVDIVTATYKTSLSSYFNLDIDQVHRAIENSGKHLVLGGIIDETQMIRAERSKAIACYPKYIK